MPGGLRHLTGFAAPVVVQLQVAGGDCWPATYSDPILRNADGTFKAKPDV